MHDKEGDSQDGFQDEILEHKFLASVGEVFGFGLALNIKKFAYLRC